MLVKFAIDNATGVRRRPCFAKPSATIVARLPEARFGGKQGRAGTKPGHDGRKRIIFRPLPSKWCKSLWRRHFWAPWWSNDSPSG